MVRKGLWGSVGLIAIWLIWFYYQYPLELPDFDLQPSKINYSYKNTLEVDTGSYYARSNWSGPHRDSRNSDYLPLISPDSLRMSWTALKGSNYFTAPVIGPDGTIYASSGGGVGKSHLHALDYAGNILWESETMQDKNDHDSTAFFSAPVIDLDSNIYIGDSNQLWSYSNIGSVRWVTDLTAIGITGIQFSSFITNNGYVGVTTSNGQVALFDRATGELASSILDLPGTNGIPTTPLPPGLFANGLIDPENIRGVWDGTFGFEMEVSNTTAVHPTLNRLYIIAVGERPEEVVLYGIDVNESNLNIAFTTPLGVNGSGTSPTLSFDGDLVYVIDGKGRMTAIDSRTGKMQWQSDKISIVAVSPIVTPDNRLITFDFEIITCFDGKTGEVLWEANTHDLAQKHGLYDRLPLSSKIYGTPTSTPLSGMIATADGIWTVLFVGVKIPIPENAQDTFELPFEGLPKDFYPQPIQYYLAKFDFDGNLVTTAPFVDGGSFMSMGIDGRMFVTTMSFNSSISYYGVSPKTPFFMDNTPEPHGGIVGYNPDSFYEYYSKRIKTNAKIAESILKDPSMNSRHLTQLRLSLATNKYSLLEALQFKEISKEKYDALNSITTTLSQNPLTNTDEIRQAADQLKLLKSKL